MKRRFETFRLAYKQLMRVRQGQSNLLLHHRKDLQYLQASKELIVVQGLNDNEDSGGARIQLITLPLLFLDPRARYKQIAYVQKAVFLTFVCIYNS